MTTKSKEQVLVVEQLTGGNDYVNTVIPYADPRYWDYRPKVGITDEQIMPLDGFGRRRGARRLRYRIGELWAFAENRG